MLEEINWFINTIWLFLPAYFANAAPVLLHGGGALDGGKNWRDGRRILVDHKTVYGTPFGIIVEPKPSWQQDVAMIITTIPIHYITNLFAWGLNWKKEPW